MSRIFDATKNLINLKFFKKYRVLKISIIVTAILLAGGLATCSYTVNKAGKMYLESENKTFDAIIVPGVPFNENNWSDVMRIRVFWSKFLYDKGIAKNIIYSGSAVYSPYYEAEIMALYGAKLGIPKEHIFAENQAEHSTENVYYSYKLARLLGFKTVALATDPFQSKMVKSFIRKELKGKITVIPIVYDTLRAMNPPMYDPVIDPSSAFDSLFISILEREGFWKRLQGTRGKNLDRTLYENKNQPEFTKQNAESTLP